MLQYDTHSVYGVILVAFLYQVSCTPVPVAVQLKENLSPVNPRVTPVGTADRIMNGSVEYTLT